MGSTKRASGRRGVDAAGATLGAVIAIAACGGPAQEPNGVRPPTAATSQPSEPGSATPAPAPAAATTYEVAVEASAVTEARFESVAAPSWKVLGVDFSAVLLGGKELAVVDKSGFCRRHATNDLIEIGATGKFSFGDDGSTLALTWTEREDMGLTVLQSPGLKSVARVIPGADPHWMGPTSLVFRRGATPVLLDTETGETSELGPPLQGFGCTDLPFIYLRRTVEACATREWGEIVALERSTGHLIVQTRTNGPFAKNLRIYDPRTGTSRVVFEDSALSSVTFEVSRDGGAYCVTEHVPPRRVLCARLGSALLEVARSDRGLAPSSAILGDKVIVADRAGPLRLVDFHRRTAVAPVFPESAQVDLDRPAVGARYVVGKVFDRDFHGIWIDLEQRRYFKVEDSRLQLDPSNGRHLVRWKSDDSSPLRQEVGETTVK